MFSLRTSVIALSANRYLGLANNQLSDSLEKLSSGFKINRARDDAAGLSISNRLSSQINGLSVGIRNASDGISLIQTAEGALNEVTNNVQRIRELAIQAASDVYTNADRETLQKEVVQLQREINRIGETTRFGERKLFADGSSPVVDVTERDIIQGLRDSWLYEAEQIILEQFGLTGKNNNFLIDLERVDGASGIQAFVQTVAGTTAADIRLVIDLDDFSGGLTDTNAQSLEGTVLHEMVHAVMAVNMDLSSLSRWFSEGSAEIVRGADERVLTEARALGGGDIQAGLIAIRDELIANWQGSTATPSTNLEIAAVYSGGYIVNRYIHSQIGESGFKKLMSELANGSAFDAALSTASAGKIASESDLFTQLNTGTTFVDFVNDMMDLYNPDIGALGGSDASGGLIRRESLLGIGGVGSGASTFNEYYITGDDDETDADVSVVNLPTIHNLGFDVVSLANYESEINGAGGKKIGLQVGASSFQTIDMTLGSINTAVLGLDNLDIVNLPQFAIYAADDALTIIDNQRATFGAVVNRLQSTINNLSNTQSNSSSSRSQIKDTDFAFETSRLVQKQLILQSSTAILAQANQQFGAALTLLS